MNKKLLLILCVLVLVIGVLFVQSTRDVPEYVWCNDMAVKVKYECYDNDFNILNEGIIMRLELNLYDYSENMDKIIKEKCEDNFGDARALETLEYLCIRDNKW